MITRKTVTILWIYTGCMLFAVLIRYPSHLVNEVVDSFRSIPSREILTILDILTFGSVSSFFRVRCKLPRLSLETLLPISYHRSNYFHRTKQEKMELHCFIEFPSSPPDWNDIPSIHSIRVLFAILFPHSSSFTLLLPHPLFQLQLARSLHM